MRTVFRWAFGARELQADPAMTRARMARALATWRRDNGDNVKLERLGPRRYRVSQYGATATMAWDRVP